MAAKSHTPKKATGRPKGPTKQQQEAFNLYVSLGDKRSCRLVAEQMGLPVLTVQDWGSKYEWTRRVKEVGFEITQEVIERIAPSLAKSINSALYFMDQMKEDYYKRIESGEIKLTTQEFFMLLKAEALLTGLPTDRSETTHVHKVQIEVTDAELQAAQRIYAAKKYNLPLPNGVTIEHESVEN